MNNKKIVVMTTLLLAIILLGVGTISYFRRSVNGNITGQTGTLVFNVNGLTGETSETLNYSLNRSASEPYVYPDDSGYFDLEITAEGSSTDVYVTLDILRDNLPDNLKFYVDEEHKVVINKKYFFFEKTEEMSDTLRIYWFWDGSVDDINDSEFINESLSARITLTAEPMEYGMMKNSMFDLMSIGGVLTGFAQPKYFTAVKEITFTNDFSGMPEACTEENLCFDISYEENQKYPVYAYLVKTDEVGTIMDTNANEYIPGTAIMDLVFPTTGNLYDMYIVCSKTVFAPVISRAMFGMHINLRNINFNDWFCTSKAINQMGMFSQCSSLTNLNLSTFDTSSVTNMASMFQDCSSLTNLNLSTFDTSSVTDMHWMFSGCSSLTNLNLNSFDTSSVTNMMSMFLLCSNLISLNLSSFDTSSVTDMEDMFSSCSSLTTTITISGNVSEYGWIFNHAAIEPNSKITVNYTSETSSLVDRMIATKTSNSNVVKGSLVS